MAGKVIFAQCVFMFPRDTHLSIFLEDVSSICEIFTHLLARPRLCVFSGHTHTGAWEARGQGHTLTGRRFCPLKNSPMLTKVHNHKLLNVNSVTV